MCLLKRHLIRLIRHELRKRNNELMLIETIKKLVECALIAHTVLTHNAMHACWFVVRFHPYCFFFCSFLKVYFKPATTWIVSSEYLLVRFFLYQDSEQIQFKLFTTCTRIRHAPASPTLVYSFCCCCPCSSHNSLCILELLLNFIASQWMYIYVWTECEHNAHLWHTTTKVSKCTFLMKSMCHVQLISKLDVLCFDRNPWKHAAMQMHTHTYTYTQAFANKKGNAYACTDWFWCLRE